MASSDVHPGNKKGRSLWLRILLVFLHLILASAALWLGMSIPSYFRSVSPLVLEAAARGSPDMAQLAEQEIRAGKPGPASMLMAAARMTGSDQDLAPIATEMDALLEERPAYWWSGGPAPFFEQFLQQARFLREDETAVIPSLLPGEHRARLRTFLEQSPNRNVRNILKTSSLGGWRRFYPVYSTSGHPLEATLLTVALMEQASAFPSGIHSELMDAVDRALAEEGPSVDDLESIYLSILTLGRYTNWLQLNSLVGSLSTRRQLVFAAQSVQEDPDRLPILYAALTNTDQTDRAIEYLLKNQDRGWEGLSMAIGIGIGSLDALLEFNRPVYRPPAFWKALPSRLRDSQQRFKGFAEAFPDGAIGMRAMAFALCGIFLAGALRSFILKHRPTNNEGRRLLINLDNLVGGTLVMLLVWVLIEPGLLDFRPNEKGSLQIDLARIAPAGSESLNETITKMIDQVTILVLLLFFVLQLLVFIFCLLKIAEVRRQQLNPELKLRLLDNEENLFDLGLYVGLGGTVGSLILVVLNVVDASLMAAYASTLFGIIFVALLKIGFLRPFRRKLILQKN